MNFLIGVAFGWVVHELMLCKAKLKKEQTSEQA